MKRAAIFIFISLASLGFAALIPATLPIAPAVSAAGNSFNPFFSADARHLIFVSHANNLVTNDDVGLWLDVFARDLVSGNTVLVSVSTNGFGGANGDANFPSVSSNGQFIAFASRASNLVAGDTNNASDVFVRDLVNGTTRLVSVDTNGTSPFDLEPARNTPLSSHPLISADGRRVFFESRATTLVPTGTLFRSVNIYARDLLSNSTALVGLAPTNNGNPGTCELSSITPDGRFTAFLTSQSVYRGQATNIFVHDLQTGETTLASSNIATLLGENNPYRCPSAALSADGRYVAFVVIPLSPPATPLVMRHDLQSGTTLVLSSNATNTANGVQISADGRFVLFEEMNGNVANVRLWDAQSGTTNITGCAAESDTRNPSMTSDAGRIAFLACSNIYIWDRLSGLSSLVTSVSETNTPLHADSPFVFPVMSADGTNIAFHTISGGLVADDLNGASDIFMCTANAEPTELITKATPSRPASTSPAHSFLGLNSISGDGRFIVTLRYDDPAAFRDTNGWWDVFVNDAVTGKSAIASISSNVYVTNYDGGTQPTVFFIDNTNVFYEPVISADGSTISATRSSPGNTRIYVAMTTNAFAGTGMTLASRGVNVSEDGNSSSPFLNSNGLLLVFTSTSTDLVPGSSGGIFPDVFLRRTTVLTNGLLSGTNELISVSLSGTEGNNQSGPGFISPDSRWVIFESRASNLTPDNTGGVPSLFARDLWSNTTHLLSVPMYLGFSLSVSPGSARTSGDSRFVVFMEQQSASTLPKLIIIHDLLAHTNMLFENGSNLINPVLGRSGRFVAYQQRDLGSALDQIYVRDLQNGHTDLVSVDATGGMGNQRSTSPLIGGDDRYIVFQSQASNLVPNDSNNAMDIFVRDRLLGITMLVSANTQGLPGNGPSSRPVIAADGRTVAFQSFATDLVTGDYNDKRDIFVLKLGGVDTEPDGMDDDWEVAYFSNLSRDGTGDFDNDGSTDLAEFLAGTDPTNNDSVFRVLTVTPMGGNSARLMWTGNPDRTYRVEFKDDLSAADWTVLNGTISWNGSTASMTDAGAGSSAHRYYRVLRLP